MTSPTSDLGPLVSVEGLAARVGDPELRVVDVRWYLKRPGAGREAYEAGHIPGAIFLDLDADLSAPEGAGRHPLPDPLAFRQHLASIGIGSDHVVVAYDDSGGTIAARLWWMLDNLGHRGVAVLDGGLGAWTAAGHPLTTAEPHHAPARLQLRDRWTRVIERDELAARLGSLRLLDARAPERYRGEVEPIDPAAGHIPTALSAPSTDNLGPDGRFLPLEKLRERFGELAGGEAEAVSYCGSGTTACHNVLAARLAGLPDPLLYVGSFSDWSRSEMPVATGPDPGRPETR